MKTYILQILHFFKVLSQHFYKSLYSSAFYNDVYTKYKGYGIKYIVTISCICSFIISSYFLYRVNDFNQYLNNTHISSSMKKFDLLINQMPTLNYNGKEISLTENSSEITKINSVSGKTIISIDTNNKLTANDMMKIPITIRKNNVNLNIINTKGELAENFVIQYKDILGEKEEVIEVDGLKEKLMSFSSIWSRVIIYTFFPLGALLLFFNVILERALLIFLIFLFVKLGKHQYALKDVIRVVFLSSGVLMLSTALSLFLAESITYILTFVQIWVNLVMISGIFKNNTSFKIFK